MKRLSETSCAITMTIWLKRRSIRSSAGVSMAPLDISTARLREMEASSSQGDDDVHEDSELHDEQPEQDVELHGVSSDISGEDVL